MNIIVGDIGGTKTILAVFSSEGGPRKPLVQMTFPSTHYESLEDIITEFLAAVNLPVNAACFAVAGPVLNGRAQITNLPWVIDDAMLQSTFNLSAVSLLNDLESVAYAVPILEPKDIHTLNEGVPIPRGSIGVVAPGTGLGEAYMTYENGKYVAHASEGSHASFAPVGKLQIDLLIYLNQHGHHHVSVERVCSGRLGIPNLYNFLKDTGVAAEPAWLAESLAASEDPTPIIFAAAQDTTQPCEIASITLDLFVSILGAEAGNLALKVLSTGGIYLGGGISPRILPYLEKPFFSAALRKKGRFESMLAEMPVHVITNPEAGLLGAAAYGLALSTS